MKTPFSDPQTGPRELTAMAECAWRMKDAGCRMAVSRQQHFALAVAPVRGKE